MHLIRRLLLIAGLVAALAVVTISLFALLLPRDGSTHILALRGTYGGFDELMARNDPDSSIHHIGLLNESGGTVASAWVRMPQRLSPHYRVVVTYAGARTGDAILDLIPPSDDLVLLAVQYPFDPPRGARANARALYDIRQAAYRTVAGGVLAVDYLVEDAGLDPDRILLLGASLGSVFATMHGALDTRVPKVILVHGGAGMPSMIEAAIVRRIPGWLLPLAVRLGTIPVDTFDPARYVARIAPRQLLVIGARHDRNFPPAAVSAFFNLANEPKQLRWTETGHVGAGKRDIVDVVLEEIAASLE